MSLKEFRLCEVGVPDMGYEIFSGLQMLGRARPARSRLAKSPEWEQIVGVLSGRGVGPGESLRIMLSPETMGLCKCSSLGLKNLLLNALQPLWKEGLAPRYRIVQGSDWLLIENPIHVTEARSSEASPQPESAALDVLSTLQRMIGSRPGHSPLLKTPEWKQIIDAVIVRGVGEGEMIRVPLSRETQDMLRNRPGGFRRLLTNGLRPLWREGLIPQYHIIQRKDCVVIQNRSDMKC